MKLKNFILFLSISIIFSFNNLFAEIVEVEEKFNNLILQNHDFKYPYSEDRNDIGIFYEFDYDKKQNKIIIKRDNNNYPIIRFSLFNNKEIKRGDTILKVDEFDLSKISDKEIIELHKKKGNFKIVIDNKTFNIQSKPYKLNEIKLATFVLEYINTIDTTKGILEISFFSLFKNHRPDLEKYASDLIEDTTYYIYEDVLFSGYWPVTSILYDEYKKDVDIRNSLEPDFYFDNNKLYTFKEENGIAQFRQKFNFKKFPFDSQTLKINLSPTNNSSADPNEVFPKGNSSVTMVTPEKGAYLGLINYKKNNILKEIGWTLKSVDITSNEIVDKNYYDSFLNKDYPYRQHSIDLILEIKRNSAHYVFKIIVPVFLILCVAWSVLWIPTYKLDARLTTSIVALLALIAYNFVFEGDIPKLEYLTDLDKFILLSYVFCCIPTFISIGFSRFILKTKKLQTRVTKINSYIRKWGGFVYLLISFQIFYSLN